MATAAKRELVSLDEYLALQQELEETKQQYGIVDTPKTGRLSKAISAFFEWRENREKVCVSKKVYILLLLFTGFLGGHRFYARRWRTGAVYLATCWCGYSIAMSLIDLLVVIPMQPDEDGKILI